jgi:hypothetical protein
MACQVFQWLIAGAGPTALEHALVGIGCLLTYDALSRWRKKRRAAQIDAADVLPSGNLPPVEQREIEQQRRAA